MNPFILYRRLAWTLVAVLMLSFAVRYRTALATILLYARSELSPTVPVFATDDPQMTTKPNFTFPTERTQPTMPSASDAVISFSPEDVKDLRIKNTSAFQPDLEELLLQPLNWNLADGKIRVLIVHTHTTECYKGDHPVVEPYRSVDENQNMIAVGEEVARVLRMHGIGVIHDKTIHDYPNYNGAYAAARKTIGGYLAQYPEISLVLDLHRDAASGDAGNLVTSATVGGQRSAQLMLVMGSDTATASHKKWKENLALGLKLSVVLEQQNPGIMRTMLLRSKRYNLDLTPGSLLVEVGAAGNTLEEAKIAANALARAIATLAKGTM